MTMEDLNRTYGQPVDAKRVKPLERDDHGDVRLNPLWTPLDEISPQALTAAGESAVWLYCVTEEGRVLLGSERVSDIVTDGQLDRLVDGIRDKAPGTTRESVLAQLDGLGHTGVAAAFTGDGRAVPGRGRVAGEFRWSASRNSWTVNDRSGRYMSDKVRPELTADTAERWLTAVARTFSEHIGARVVADPFKTAGAQTGPARTMAQVAALRTAGRPTPSSAAPVPPGGALASHGRVAGQGTPEHRPSPSAR